MLGAGVSGLTSAVALLEAGHRVQLVAAEPSLATTSALAAAVWFPTHVGPRERVLRWGRETFRVLAEQAAARVPGVVMRESLALYRQAPGDPEWASAVGGVRRAQADELPPGYRHGLRFAVPLAEMPRYLPWLVARVRSLGGELIRRRVSSLDELSEGVDVVVNCAGLGALELASDPTVYPVRGRIVRVTNPGLTMSVRDEEHPGGRAYVHPRAQDCILGGTLEKGEWDTAVDPICRRGDLRALLRSRARAAWCAGVGAGGRPAPRPADRPPRGGRVYRCRGTARAQLWPRRCRDHPELGLRRRGHDARRCPQVI